VTGAHITWVIFSSYLVIIGIPTLHSFTLNVVTTSYKLTTLNMKWKHKMTLSSKRIQTISQTFTFFVHRSSKRILQKPQVHQT